MRLRLLALAGAVAVAAPAVAQGDAPIGFTLKSWGKPLHEWRMMPDGAIRYTFVEEIPGGGFHHYRLVTKETPASPPRYRWVADRLRDAEAKAGTELPCGGRIPDLPYGTVSWGAEGSARVLRYDVGCRDESTQRLVAGIKQVHDQILVWTRDAPVTAHRTVGTPPQ